MPQVFSNFATSQIQGAISDVQTTFNCLTTDGGKFQNIPATSTDYELLLITDGINWEVVKVITRIDDTFTVERGYEGLARPWPDGVMLRSMVSQATLDNFIQKNGLGASLALFAYQNLR